MSVSVDAAQRLEAVYSEMLPAVFGFARSRVSEADAEDVTAEVFRAALQRLRADPSIKLTRSWFLTVARNLIIDGWRRRMRWDGRLELLRRDVEVEPFRSSDTNADRLLDALDRLSADHRAVLILRYVDGCSSKEISEAIGRSPRAVDSLIARAREAFTTSFEEVSA
jgi:RNA polymerase sigma-70 factor (ECF subfamily)